MSLIRMQRRSRFAWVGACALFFLHVGLIGAATEEEGVPSRVAKLMQEAQVSFGNRDYSRSSELLYRAISINQDNAVAWLRLGRALGRGGSFEDAWRAFDKSIELALIADDGARSQAIEAEARLARAEIAIDVALADLAATRGRTTSNATRANAEMLERQLVAARDFRSAPTVLATAAKQTRATGKVSGGGPASVGIEVIEGGTSRPKPAMPEKPKN
jgi:tetratricopeptide (TPR) repeat protein